MPTLQEQVEKEVREAVHRAVYRDSPTDRAVAYHEVAHALASHTVGLKMASISVSDHSSGVMRNVDRPKPEVDGTPEEIAARLRREYPDAIAKACRKEIVTFLAGRAADLFAGDKGLPVGSSASDLAEADKLADIAVDRGGPGSPPGKLPRRRRGDCSGGLAAHPGVRRPVGLRARDARVRPRNHVLGTGPSRHAPGGVRSPPGGRRVFLPALPASGSHRLVVERLTPHLAGRAVPRAARPADRLGGG